MSRARVLIAWLLVAPAVVWAVMRLLGLERGFPLVPLTAYTPYAAGAAVVAALAAVALRSRGAAVAGSLAALALVAVVLPRALGGDAPPAGEPVRVLSANVAAGSVPADALVALVRRERPDVLSVQELTPAYADRLARAGLARVLPHAVLEPRTGYAGTGLYARTRLRARPPVEATFVMAAASSARPRYEILAVHPPPPLRPDTMALWRRGLRAMPPAAPRGPVRILAGDFNATLDHAELRRVLDGGYRDAADAVGAGLRGTWPSGTRGAPPVAIDHVLADERAGVRAVSIHPLPGSDHRAVLAELVLPDAAGPGGS